MKKLWLCVAVVSGWCAWAAAQSAAPAPLLKFAALADIQYADKVTLGPRHYRQAPAKLALCAAEFERQQPAFIIHLGDLTDGRMTAADRQADVATITAVIKKIPRPWHYVLGNHDAAAGRELLIAALGFKDFYYTFTQPGLSGWRFVVLDGNDAGYGVVSAKQLAWFRGVLTQAQSKGERVICFCHFPLLEAASQRGHIMHKPAPVLEALDSAPCVVAWICGHDHAGGYALRKGVYHLTMQGTCESKDQPAMAIISLFPDRLSVTGFGREPSREMPFATNAVPFAAPAPAPAPEEALRPAA
ncbi:MAG: metallophosphoesterase [Kiritimatiellaeota bacterium]|nr:metallophosphoesterase [Kiritimatiellota bacterium]